VWKRLLGAAALAVVLLGTGSGCRFFCDRYCDRRDDYCDRRDRCNDPCRTPPRASDCP
jgi:hypothetical protein